MAGIQSTKFHLNIRKKFFTVQWPCTGTERLWSLPCWWYSELPGSGHSPVLYVLGRPWLSREVGPEGTPCTPFQPDSFCDSVIYRKLLTKDSGAKLVFQTNYNSEDAADISISSKSLGELPMNNLSLCIYIDAYKWLIAGFFGGWRWGNSGIPTVNFISVYLVITTCYPGLLWPFIW